MSLADGGVGGQVVVGVASNCSDLKSPSHTSHRIEEEGGKKTEMDFIVHLCTGVVLSGMKSEGETISSFVREHGSSSTTLCLLALQIIQLLAFI